MVWCKTKSAKFNVDFVADHIEKVCVWDQNQRQKTSEKSAFVLLLVSEYRLETGVYLYFI